MFINSMELNTSTDCIDQNQQDSGKWVGDVSDDWRPVILPNVGNNDSEITTFNNSTISAVPNLTNQINNKENEKLNLQLDLKMDLVIYDSPLNFIQPNLESEDFCGDAKWNCSKKSNFPYSSVNVQIGLVGLTNLGNTCFMNAGLQCLFNNINLVNYFFDKSLKENPRLNLANNSLTSCFISLLNKVWNKNRNYTVIKPTEFKEIMSQTYPQFQGYRQHDCQEFLTLLLDTLHDQINIALNQNSLGESLDLLILEKESKLTSSNPTSQNSPFSNPSLSIVDTCSRTTSPKSSDSISTSSTYYDHLSEEDENIRLQPIPEDIKAFIINEPIYTNIISSNNLSNSNSQKVETEKNCNIFENNNINKINLVVDKNSQVKNLDKNCNVIKVKKNLVNDNDQIKKKNYNIKEDINLSEFVKDSKTKNTNVLGDCESNQELSFDSKKFSKKIIQDSSTNQNGEEFNFFKDLPEKNNLDYLEIDSNISDETTSNYPLSKKNNKRNNESAILNIDIETNLDKSTTINNSNLSDENEFNGKILNNIQSQKRLKLDHENKLNLEDKNQFDLSENEWNRYIDKNKSVFVDTFQGQFKSTVKCSICSHISVTYEPFMYLPVPLPDALEKQIFVTFIPDSSNIFYNTNLKSAKRFLFVMNKHDKLEKLENILKEQLYAQSLADKKIQLCLAEIENKCVKKFLDINTCVKYVDDKYQELYAFEITDLFFKSNSSSNKLWDQDQNNLFFSINKNLTDQQLIPASCITEDLNLSQNECKKNINLNNQNENISIGNGVENHNVNHNVTHNESHNGNHNGNHNENQSQKENENQDEMENEIEFDNDIDKKNGFKEIDNFYDNYIVKNKDDIGTLNETNLEDYTNSIMFSSNYPVSPVTMNSFFARKYFMTDTPTNNSSPCSPRNKTPTVPENPDNSNLISIPLSCAICLEDKAPSQLLIHTACSCQLCSNCLDMTVKHCYENERNFLCPTCSQLIDKSDFIPFGFKKESCSISYLTIPILFRIFEKYKNFKLVIRPILLKLPNLVSGRELYEIIDKYVPCPCPYSLHYVDKKGQKCSRCDWNHNCNGCEITRIGDVYIQPTDNIAVEFESSYVHELDQLMPEVLKNILDDSSVKNYKQVTPLTLNDCLNTFNQSEILDDDNPWFCPVCNCHQKAKKSLIIWKCPDTLIIYLKRFVFQEMNSIKIDDPVEFSINDFDITPYFQNNNANKIDQNLVYNLQSVVCHSGGINSGHYTAYSRSLINKKWYYFNDENISLQEPNNNDERAYILFYQRNNLSLNPNILSDFNISRNND